MDESERQGNSNNKGLKIKLTLKNWRSWEKQFLNLTKNKNKERMPADMLTKSMNSKLLTWHMERIGMIRMG